MGIAKDIRVEPITSSDANRIIRALHYSGKVVPNSKIHFGVYLNGRCGGALSFGPPMRKDLMLGLVEGLRWGEIIELNRMALADWLPRNGESRSISVALRLLRKSYNHLKIVLSFADGCQCGDGAIYRASGFVLTQIKNNTEIWRNKDTGERQHTMQHFHKGTLGDMRSGAWEQVEGNMFRYIYFLDPTARERLTVPIIPFSEIQRRGAGMYLGKPSAGSIDADAPDDQSGEGGSTPTPALQQANRTERVERNKNH